MTVLHMTPDEVDRMLFEYKERVGRRGHLEAELTRLEAVLSEVTRDMVDVATAKAQRYDDMDMPRASGTSDPTASIGTAFADGFMPRYIMDLKIDIHVVRTELKRCRETLMMVEGWLKGLTEKERWIIERQVFEGETWREIGVKYAELYGGGAYSRNSLRAIKRRALRKIYKITQ